MGPDAGVPGFDVESVTELDTGKPTADGPIPLSPTWTACAAGEVALEALLE